MKARTVLAIAAGAVGGFLAPMPNPKLRDKPGEPPTTPLPSGLPGPTERFFRAAYGDWIPITDTVSIWGSVIMKLGPVWTRATMRTHHRLGSAYAARFALRWFGLPVFEGREGFAEGRGFSKIGGSLVEGWAADQANSLAMWSEAHIYPHASLLNPDVGWHEIDDFRTGLTIPVGDRTVEATITYDPLTGYPSTYEAMRHRNETDTAPWKASYAGWRRLNGLVTPEFGTVQWMDEDSPWLKARFNGARANLDDPFGPLSP